MPAIQTTMRKAFFVIGPILLLVIAGYLIVREQHWPDAGDTKVIIYTTSWCPYCEVLRRTLDDYDIPYTEYDTEKSWPGRLGYWVLGAQGVPVSVIGEQIIQGYDGQTITDALVGAGYELASDWPDEDSD